MKLTILGSSGPLPAQGGACSGYLLESETGEALLLDLGSGSLANLVKARDPLTLRAIILSHLHWDHISDMLPLGYLNGMAGIPVYAQDGPDFAVAALQSVGWKLQPHESAQIGPFAVSFLPARHPVAASCVKIECEGKIFVYTGDTNTLPGLAEFARDADLLLADAGLCEADWAENKPHLSPRLCADLARESGAKKLALTHIAPKNPAELILAEADFPGAETAAPGKIFSI